ncbi:MAG: hypothetical protein IKD72_09745 [Clostridia bacterium]|nr:hypothetical protein [Clostridia bacterium]
MYYTITCPKCGKMNQNLDLVETDGWYECDACLKKQRVKEPLLRLILPKPAPQWRKAG